MPGAGAHLPWAGITSWLAASSSRGPQDPLRVAVLFGLMCAAQFHTKRAINHKHRALRYSMFVNPPKMGSSDIYYKKKIFALWKSYFI
jgi:hypothetical protein